MKCRAVMKVVVEGMGRKNAKKRKENYNILREEKETY